jgi:two-component system sensor histidine kinase PhcS
MQRSRTIISDLHAFAYPSEADKLSPFDIGEALESAIRFTSHELRGISVESDLPPGTIVVGSKNHITQVLVNLLANSAKAIEEAGRELSGTIRVTGAVRESRLVITLADNGVGMDGKTLERIFDPFFTTREVGEGMGLGLSVCHTIVANHGGRILAYSKPGEGTQLVFDLPLEADSDGDIC